MNNDKVVKFFITFFLGWLGIHKFMEQKIGLGILYLLTCGVFGVAWFIDSVVAFLALFNSTDNNTNNHTQSPNLRFRKELVTTINTKVVGVTFSCVKNGYVTRQELIKKIYSLKTPIYLEPYQYEGEPANYVILKKNGFDIGNLKATLSKELANKYNDCIFETRITDLTGDEDGKDTAGCNIAIDVYRMIDNYSLTVEEN